MWQNMSNSWFTGDANSKNCPQPGLEAQKVKKHWSRHCFFWKSSMGHHTVGRYRAKDTLRVPKLAKTVSKITTYVCCT
jgi:hypothetical protein